VPAIEVENLTKRYGDVTAIDDVSFTVDEGEVFGILGPNGAGKTTTVESIAGLRHPDSGTIRVLGLDPRHDQDVLHRRLGVQLQESRLPERIKVGEALDLYSSFYETPADWEGLLDRLGLTEKRDTRFGKLSGGQKQRVSIALALVGNPEVVILDELTTGLDPQARRDTWTVVEDLRDTGVSVILVTHLMEEAERLADRVALIDSGRLVALDTPAGLVASTDNTQVISFRPSRPLDDTVFAGLAGVNEVTRHGDQIVIRGTGNVLHAVSTTLVENQVIAQELRLDQANLDDAFLALTGRSIENDAVEV
jgi:ABC-2 type transport system ATP-binding protein